MKKPFNHLFVLNLLEIASFITSVFSNLLSFRRREMGLTYFGSNKGWRIVSDQAFVSKSVKIPNGAFCVPTPKIAKIYNDNHNGETLKHKDEFAFFNTKHFNIIFVLLSVMYCASILNKDKRDYYRCYQDWRRWRIRKLSACEKKGGVLKGFPRKFLMIVRSDWMDNLQTEVCCQISTFQSLLPLYLLLPK